MAERAGTSGEVIRQRTKRNILLLQPVKSYSGLPGALAGLSAAGPARRFARFLPLIARAKRSPGLPPGGAGDGGGLHPFCRARGRLQAGGAQVNRAGHARRERRLPDGLATGPPEGRAAKATAGAHPPASANICPRLWPTQTPPPRGTLGDAPCSRNAEARRAVPSAASAAASRRSVGACGPRPAPQRVGERPAGSGRHPPGARRGGLTQGCMARWVMRPRPGRRRGAAQTASGGNGSWRNGARPLTRYLPGTSGAPGRAPRGAMLHGFDRFAALADRPLRERPAVVYLAVGGGTAARLGRSSRWAGWAYVGQNGRGEISLPRPARPTMPGTRGRNRTHNLTGENPP